MGKKEWQPLQRGSFGAPSEELITLTMSHFKCDRATALKHINGDDIGTTVWINDTYQVQVRPMEDGSPFVTLNIRRRDGDTIFRDWRIFQRIKNELVGEECEAIELYPAESRLRDECNKYHLFACTDPTFRFPFGFAERLVVTDKGGKSAGLRQRPWVDNYTPRDLDHDPTRGTGSDHAAVSREEHAARTRGERP